MFERMTDRARRVIVHAQDEARELGHSYVGTEHLLLSLIHDGEGVAAKVLDMLKVSLGPARDQVKEIVGQSTQVPTGHMPFTPNAKKVLELSGNEATLIGHAHIGTEHILLGLTWAYHVFTNGRENTAVQVLTRLGVDPDRVRRLTLQFISLLERSDGPVEPMPTSFRVAVNSRDAGKTVTIQVPSGWQPEHCVLVGVGPDGGEYSYITLL